MLLMFYLSLFALNFPGVHILQQSKRRQTSQRPRQNEPLDSAEMAHGHKRQVRTVENVPEFTRWGPLDDDGKPIKKRAGEYFAFWVRTPRSLGYDLDWQLDFVHLRGVGEDVGELSVNCGWGFSAVGFQPRQLNMSVGQPQHEVRRFGHVSNFCAKSRADHQRRRLRRGHLTQAILPTGAQRRPT